MSESDWAVLTARISPAHFARLATKGRYQIARHVELLNRKLLEVANGKLEGLVVSMPPRHGKSTLISHYFPAWFLGTFPNKRVILASSEATLASSFGRKARDVLQFWGPQIFGVGVRSDSKAANHWSVDGHEGGMDTAGIGGSLTGRGADLFIVDDPIKNHEQALSDLFRNKAWEMWMSVVETRAEPGCGFVLVQTRWHENDLAGRVIDEIQAGRRKGWEILVLPAICEDEGDPLGRKPGEALWPKRFPVERLEALRNRWDHDEARLGPYWWEALYQQRPTPRSGGDIQRSWFRYFKFDDEFVYLDRAGKVDQATGSKIDESVRYKKFARRDLTCFLDADLAISEKSTADFFAMGTWYLTPEMDLLLWDVHHERISGPKQADLIARVNAEKRPAFVGIESVGYQLALVQECILRGIPAKEVKVDKDKRARLQLAATRFAVGSIYFRSGAPWLTAVEDELVSFPNGRHDDLVDMCSMAASEAAFCVIPQVY